jgi:small subunit ribosomal protein S2e
MIGHCGSVWVCLIPDFRSTGMVSAPVPKKLLRMVLMTMTHQLGASLSPWAIFQAPFDSISKTYHSSTPDFWKETGFTKSPNHEFTDHLVKTYTRVSVQRTQAPSVATHKDLYARKRNSNKSV